MSDIDELEMQLLEREMKMDQMHDDAILSGKCCMNCKWSRVEKLPNNWWKPTYYCEDQKRKVLKIGFCERWEKDETD